LFFPGPVQTTGPSQPSKTSRMVCKKFFQLIHGIRQATDGSRDSTAADCAALVGTALVGRVFRSSRDHTQQGHRMKAAHCRIAESPHSPVVDRCRQAAGCHNMAADFGTVMDHLACSKGCNRNCHNHSRDSRIRCMGIRSNSLIGEVARKKLGSAFTSPS
jgi:hypothetical protein